MIKVKRQNKKRTNTNIGLEIGFVMYVIIIIIHFVRFVIDVKLKQSNSIFSNNCMCNLIRITILIFNRCITNNIITINSNNNKD